MGLELLDDVLEQTPERVIACKKVTSTDEYLRDHFPSFPVLPGVLMLETMVQAARRLIESRDPQYARHVLGDVRALKYGAMVRPGDTLKVEVTLIKEPEPGRFDFKGVGTVHAATGDESRTAVSGKFSLRPIHT